MKMRDLNCDKYEVAKGIKEDVQTICANYDKREVASEGEHAVAMRFYDEMSQCTDDVVVEKFFVHPHAFWGWSYVSATCMILSFASYFFSALVSILFALCAVAPFLVQYIFQKEFFDSLYPQKTSQNVVATKHCTGEKKRSIYFVANVDATYELSVKYRLGGVAFVTIIAMSALGMLFMIGASIAKWAIVGGVGAQIANGATLYVGIAGAVFVPFWMSLYFLINYRRVIDGANENLTGCEVAVSTLKALKDVEFENCDVSVILTGAGSVGSRGAKAWCDAHKNDVDKENSIFICLNTLREIDWLQANTNDVMGLKKCDKDVVDLIANSAKECDLQCKRSGNIGYTDSSAFLQNGLKSASISAVNKRIANYYHTRYDSAENMSEKCIAEAFALALKIVENYTNEN